MNIVKNTITLFGISLISLLLGTPYPAHADLTVKRLDVPYYKQELSLSCEVASLRIALGAQGANVSESSLRGLLAYDPTPKRNGVWGDPDIGFVGKINGSMLITGYGVNPDPIAKLGMRFRRTESFKGKDLQTLTNHLDAGRPVIIWGYYGNGAKHYWQTPQGKLVEAVQSEHARVVVGYYGPASYPDAFIVFDPVFGELTWTWEQLWNNWQALSGNSVAVYRYPRWAITDHNATVWEINKDGTLRQGLAMSWDMFIAGGGLGENIVAMNEQELLAIPEGPPLYMLQ